MQKQLPQPSSSVVTPSRRRADTPQKKKVKKPAKLEFSKQLSIVDIVCWTIITLLLLIVMLVQPALAEYCVSIFGAATAAYVSLRLGYTAKAGVENYKKIAQNYNSVMYGYYDDEGNG